MKGVALLYTLLACSVAIFGETEKPGFLPNGCPETNMTWLLPHETDCTLFYICNLGGRVLRQCGPGTHFNRDLQICDWPQNAKCTTSSQPTTPGPSMEGPTTPGPSMQGPTTAGPTMQGPTTPGPTMQGPTSEKNGPTTSEPIPPEISAPASTAPEQSQS
ncbi:peritrophin-1-like [Aricia agestis]|uniref:peritrophin-1-like n=1 Tax=Aricia agestis TaxID=91739 RepID=UPI001C2047CF|nr:peritrophin-1-like [Aricia agestis]